MGKKRERAYSDIELVRIEIISNIRSLHNHLLSIDGSGSESQLEASTTFSLCVSLWAVERRKAICKRIRNGKRRLVGAGESSATVAARLCVDVGKMVVVSVAGLDGSSTEASSGHGVLPGAGWFAAVPVAGGMGVALRGRQRLAGRE
jgi:hypothetical protein